MRTTLRRILPIICSVALALIGLQVGAVSLAAQQAAGVALSGAAPALHVAAPSAMPAPQAPQQAGGEANLVIPDLSNTTVPVTFFGKSGRAFLVWGLLVCVLGLVFGLVMYTRLKNMPVHSSMRAISELIYETCKTYLITQGKFILLLEVFIGIVIALYFGVLVHFPVDKVIIILIFSLIGIAGSYGVAWFGIRVNTFANSRTAFAALRGKPYPCYAIPLSAGMSIGMLLI